MSSLTIQEYTEKSFLVFDEENPEGTKKYKESLMAMGGKYGSRFKWDDDGKCETGINRSAYMFPKTKMKIVEEWITKGCPGVESEGASKGASTETDLQKKIYKKMCAIEEKLDYVIKRNDIGDENLLKLIKKVDSFYEVLESLKMI